MLWREGFIDFQRLSPIIFDKNELKNILFQYEIS